MRHLLEALSGALFVLLLAPPLAAAVYAVIAALTTDLLSSQTLAVDAIILSGLGFAVGAYLLGGIPAFLAGAALPTIQRYLPAFPAALLTGCLGTAVYFSSFGSHLLTGPHALRTALTFGVPAGLGTAIAAYVYASRRAEA